MTLCNNAFITLSDRLDDILGASFEVSPRGQKTRVAKVANMLMQLLTNSFYSLSWLNAKYYQSTHPGEATETYDSDRMANIA